MNGRVNFVAMKLLAIRDKGMVSFQEAKLPHLEWVLTELVLWTGVPEGHCVEVSTASKPNARQGNRHVAGQMASGQSQPSGFSPSAMISFGSPQVFEPFFPLERLLQSSWVNRDEMSLRRN